MIDRFDVTTVYYLFTVSTVVTTHPHAMVVSGRARKPGMREARANQSAVEPSAYAIHHNRIGVVL